MKFFITNKIYFDSIFGSLSKMVHLNAFNELSKSVSDNNIPIILLAEYKDFGDAIFEFKSKKNDVYFYEFLGTAS